jgi:hypothetical protein
MLEKIRNSHNARLYLIGGLIVLCIILFYFAKTTTAKIILGGVIALLLAAFGMEATQNDYDMERLIETKSFSESKIERDATTGNIINVDEFCAAEKIDYNCSDFKNQSEAMAVYKRCGEMGKNMDVFRLDGDKDGLVCEALPSGAQ